MVLQLLASRYYDQSKSACADTDYGVYDQWVADLCRAWTEYNPGPLTPVNR